MVDGPLLDASDTVTIRDQVDLFLNTDYLFFLSSTAIVTSGSTGLFISTTADPIVSFETCLAMGSCSDQVSVTRQIVVEVSEPQVLGLLGLGLIGLGIARRKTRSA